MYTVQTDSYIDFMKGITMENVHVHVHVHTRSTFIITSVTPLFWEPLGQI